MKLIDLLRAHAESMPDARAFVASASGEYMTYSELWERSGAIASMLANDAHDAGASACETGAAEAHEAVKAPVVVYGHKSPLMLASFIGCLRAGRAYVPVDVHSVPAERVASIVSQVRAASGCATVLAAEPLPEAALAHASRVIAPEELFAIALDAASVRAGIDPESCVSGEDPAYIIFTSGSTGAPKGVVVTASCVDSFFPWALSVAGVESPGIRFLNQAPFSFDLSVYELSMTLASGGQLLAMEKATLDRATDMLAFLGQADPHVWVSTPSFAEMCLANQSFKQDLMPSLRVMLFCGEALPNPVAAQLMERFPGARVVNSYGPTESTVAVAAVEVDGRMCASPDPLPVGRPRPGTRIRVVDPATGEELPQGEWGEVLIAGDTVAKGYLGREDLTRAVFGEDAADWLPGRENGAEGVAAPGEPAPAARAVRTYRTGDEGMMGEDGLLRFRGRLDLQVKLNGYRLELGEIEDALRALPDVAAAAVVAARKNGKVSHLVAHVVSAGPREQSDFRCGLALKDALKARLPHYMIPKKVVFDEALPMTPNGKLDRRALTAREDG